MQNSLLTFESSKTGWTTHESLETTHPYCITIDPRNPNRAYCGTFGDGLWKTEDIGQTWNRIGKDGIACNDITSVSISHLDNENKMYVGTEPTTLYRSNDRGESWQKMSALNKLKSSTSWSFPPRPWTSHVRWIELDSSNPDYVYVAIEAGALVQSHDGGDIWIDRVDETPYDTHTLVTHKKMPGRLYSAAGDGYFESNDYGQTWKRLVAGLDHNDYLSGLAVDSGDPKTVIVSASQGAYQAHSRTDAESMVYRRISSVDDTDSNNGSDEDWELVSKGLPEPHGTIISILAANPKIAGEFYAVNNRGIFCSTDSGISWKMLKDDIEWPKEYLSQHPMALAVS